MATAISAETDERYKLTIGGSLTSYDSKVRINSRDGSVDNEVDFEDVLGLDNEVQIGWIQGVWRISERHRLRLRYMPIRRSSEKTSGKDVDVGGNIIKAGATLGASSFTQVTDFEYIYSFYKRPRLELGLTVGVYWMNILTELNASGQVKIEGSNQAEFFSSYKANQRLIAPLPLIGLAIEYDISSQWRALASARYFDITVGAVQGRILSLTLGSEYYVTDHIGAGVSLTTFDLSVKHQGVVFFNTLTYQYEGIQAFLAFKY